MITWLKSLFAWYEVRRTPIWIYQENWMTKKRRAVRISRCWQPLDRDWLDGASIPGEVINSAE